MPMSSGSATPPSWRAARRRIRAKQEWEREEARRREELDRAEGRIEERRSSLDRKYDLLVEKDRQLEDRQKELDGAARRRGAAARAVYAAGAGSASRSRRSPA
jgi:hypothetical protein